MPVDKAEAARWYRKAADQGVATAQFFMGNIYREGRGVAKDDARRRGGIKRPPTRGTLRLPCYLDCSITRVRA